MNLIFDPSPRARVDWGDMLSSSLLHAAIGHFLCDVINHENYDCVPFSEMRSWIDSTYIEAFFEHMYAFYEGDYVGLEYLDRSTIHDEEIIADIVLLSLDEALGLMASLSDRFPETLFDAVYVGRHGRAFHLCLHPRVDGWYYNPTP